MRQSSLVGLDKLLFLKNNDVSEPIPSPIKIKNFKNDIFFI